MVRARNVFLTALRLRDLSILDFAKANGLSSPNIRQKINGNETIRATELFYLLGLLHIDCEFVIREDSNEAENTGSTVIMKSAKDVSVKDIFRTIIGKRGISAYEASRRLGLNEQSLTQKIMQRETIQANEFFDVLEHMDVSVMFYDSLTGNILLSRGENRKDISGMSDCRSYNTAKSVFITSSYEANGYGHDGKGVDLYVDTEGNYFVVEYTDGEEKGRIRAVPVHVANAIIDEFGSCVKPV